MKIKIGAIITDATGKIGGSTIAKNNGVLVMKNKNAHRLQSTNKQQIQRAKTQFISSSWSKLTDQQRENFRLQTDFYSKANFYSDNAKFTPFGLFKLINQSRLQLNLSLLTNPNETHRPTFPQGVNVEASTDEIIVSSDLYNSDDIVLLYSTRSLQKGIRRPHRYLKYIGSVTAAELNTGIDIKAMYDDVFTPLQENDNFFIATKTVSNISFFSNGLIIANENPTTVNSISDPLLLSGLIGYYNPENINETTPGSFISTWLDASVNSYNLTSPTPPTLVYGSAGDKQVYFNGVDQYLIANSNTIYDFTPTSDEFTIVVKMGDFSVNSTNYFLGKISNSGSGRQYGIYGSSSRVGSIIGGDGLTNYDDDIPTGNDLIFLLVSTSEINVIWNDTTVLTGAIGSSTNNEKFCLAARGLSTPAVFVECSFSRIALYNRVLTPTEIANIQATYG